MIQRKFQQFMYGRYGTDLLNLVLIICGMILLLVGQLFWLVIISAIAYVFYGYAIFRSLSKNIPARQRELFMFLNLLRNIKAWFGVRKNIILNIKTHKYFKCPRCKQWLRAPRGRGKIQVRCQKCRNEFIKKV